MWIEADKDKGTLTHPRQRHRHEPRGSHLAPRHHRALRHRRVLQEALGRPAEGFAAHRPVRRGLLFRLHRRRARGSPDAAAPDCRAGEGVRWESSADGEFTVETVEQRRARHHHRAAPQGRREGVPRHLAPALAGAALFRSHRLPGAHAEGRRGDARIRGRQPRHGAVGASQGRDQGRGVHRVLPPPHPRLGRAAHLVAQPGRGQARLHQPALHPGGRALRPVAARRRRAA